MRAANLILLLLFPAWTASAQPRFEDFDPADSSLLLSVADLPSQPTKARELKGSNPTVRYLQYTWGVPQTKGVFADVIVIQLVAEGKVYTRAPDYPVQLATALPYVKFAGPNFDSAEYEAIAPLGLLKYRMMQMTGLSCVGFGGLFGSAVFQGGNAPTGDKWIYGLYCPSAGEILTPEDGRHLLEGFGWKGIGLAAPDRVGTKKITSSN